MKIYHKTTGAVLLDLPGRTTLCGADMRGADMRGADMRGANLTGADMRDADLTRADLRGARLTGADLTRANLAGAILTCADLSGANLRGAEGLPEVPVVEELDRKILSAIEGGGALDMRRWHTCEACRLAMFDQMHAESTLRAHDTPSNRAAVLNAEMRYRALPDKLLVSLDGPTPN